MMVTMGTEELVITDTKAMVGTRKMLEIGSKSAGTSMVTATDGGFLSLPERGEVEEVL